MKKATALALVLFMILLVSAGCGKKNVSIGPMSDEDIHTDYAGVYLTLESVDNSGENKKLSVKWHNETESEVIYGASYIIEYKDGEKWSDVSRGEISWIEIACILQPKSTNNEVYTTEYFDISKEGCYRLRSEFSAGNSGSYSTWIEFRVQQSAN